MIQADQPAIFPNSVLVATSSMANGTIRHPNLDTFASGNIRKWCSELGVPIGDSIGLKITYGDDRSYTNIATVTKSLDRQGAATPKGWQPADAFVTSAPGLAMLLPVADCNAVTLYDPAHHVLALAHLGWHSTVNNLASKLVDYMVERFAVTPATLLVHFTPSIRKESYHFKTLEPTHYTDWHNEPYAIKLPNGKYAIDLVAYNVDQLVSKGVVAKNIEISPINTAENAHYNSHFARHTEGDTARTTGRFACLAMLKPTE